MHHLILRNSEARKLLAVQITEQGSQQMESDDLKRLADQEISIFEYSGRSRGKFESGELGKKVFSDRLICLLGDDPRSSILARPSVDLMDDRGALSLDKSALRQLDVALYHLGYVDQLSCYELDIDRILAEEGPRHPHDALNRGIAQNIYWFGWVERYRQRGLPEPRDGSGSCKFASLFAKLVFGGKICGNPEHLYVKLGDTIIDFSEASEDVRGLDAPYTDIPEWLENEDLKKSLISCLPRVSLWYDRFLDQKEADFFKPEGL